MMFCCLKKIDYVLVPVSGTVLEQWALRQGCMKLGYGKKTKTTTTTCAVFINTVLVSYLTWNKN